MKIHTSHLAARVAAFNAVNAEANRIRPILLEFLKPFVGKKIAIQGGMIKQIRDNLPEVGEGFRMYRDDTEYSLRFTIQRDENYRGNNPKDSAHHYSTRATVTLWMGSYNRTDHFTSGCNLAELRWINAPWPTNYTVELVKDKRDELKRARDSYQAAQSDLWPFGEYDNG